MGVDSQGFGCASKFSHDRVSLHGDCLLSFSHLSRFTLIAIMFSHDPVRSTDFRMDFTVMDAPAPAQACFFLLMEVLCTESSSLRRQKIELSLVSTHICQISSCSVQLRKKKHFMSAPRFEHGTLSVRKMRVKDMS